MNPAEKALHQALEADPSDWSVRLIILDKMVDRGALDEAAQLVESAPGPPETEEQLQRAIEIAGVHALDAANGFVQTHPASGFAHHALGELLEAAGDRDLSEKHLAVASALGVDTGHAGEEEAPAPAGADRGALAESTDQPWSQPPAPGPPRKKRGPKATAALIAVLVHVGLLFIAAILVILPPARDQPEIIASVIGPPAKQNEMQKKNVVKQTKRSTSASSASAPIAQMMRANAMAKFALPQVTRTSTGPLGMGEGNLGAGGFGTSSGLGSGASFFGGTAKGNRFCFILDYSGSMNSSQMKLVVSEMERTLKALKPGTQYQVILFAGGGKFAEPGWSADNEKNRDAIIKDPEGKVYEFVSKRGYSDYAFTGSDANLPTSKWLDTTPAQVKATIKVLNIKDLWGGTDWRWPFKMALNLVPAPDVIFFMSDGTGGANPPTILRYAKKKNPVVQINAFAMETIAGAAEMNELAERTKGDYRVILRNGKTVEGEEVFKDKAKVLQLIKSGGK